MTQQQSKSFIWAFVGRSLTGYRFELSRGREAPIEALGNSDGAFCSDDYVRPLFVRLLLLACELRRAHGPKTLLGRAARYTWNNMRSAASCTMRASA